MNSTILGAPDIVCDGCATAIKKALARISGVSEVEVGVDEKRVIITHDDTVARSTLVAAMDRAGFPTS